MIRLSYHARVFLAGLVGVLVLGGAGWLGWMWYFYPMQHLSNGMSFRIARSWKTLDVGILPTDIRPLIVYVNPKERRDRLTIVKHRGTAVTLDQLAQEIGAQVKRDQGGATVTRKVYLGEHSTRPFVLVSGPKNTAAAATLIKSGSVVYVVTASFPIAQEGTFGKAAVSIMKHLTVK